jgi:hypothetical protein
MATHDDILLAIGRIEGKLEAYATLSQRVSNLERWQAWLRRKNGNEIGEFTVIPTHVARFPILVKNLAPGTIYIFQARASNKIGFNDWSDPVSFMAT